MKFETIGSGGGFSYCMHEKGFSRKFELSVVAVFTVIGVLLFGIFAFRKLRANGTVKPYRFDRYSGTTVMNANHAAAIMVLRHANAPLPGEVAPDSDMIDAKSGRRVSLYSLLKDKPMVLIFGSSSCSNLDSYLPDISAFCDLYGEKVDFSFVYLREAHPEGGFMPNLNRNGKDLTMPPLPDPKSIKERRRSANEFQAKTSRRLRVFVDSLDDEMAVRWGSWPDRIFVIGPDRKVLYCGGPGPFHFRFNRNGWHSKPPPEIENAFDSMPYSRISLEEFLDNLE